MAALAGTVVAFGACEALRAVAPRGAGFRTTMARRAGLLVGRALVVTAVIVTGGLVGMPVAALSAGVLLGWLAAAVHDFAGERRRGAAGPGGAAEGADAGC